MGARVGLTGGIGSGKSTVAALLRSRGIPVIDADQVARDVTLPGTGGLAAIVSRHGSGILNEEGALDRAALGTIVFDNPAEREWLERLLHPSIREHMDAFASNSENLWCVLEIPLLVESGRHDDMDANVVVDCPASVRMDRLLGSRSLSRERIERIMSTQASDAERLAIADYVIRNEGMERDLDDQIDSLVAALDARFTVSSSHIH